MELKMNSNSGFAIRDLFLVGQASALSLAFIECDGVVKPRLEGLRRNKGAQTGVSVPLKGETKSKRAGRMPALQRRKLKGNCAVRRPVFLVSGFDFLSFSTSHTPAQASHTSSGKLDWSFVQTKDRSLKERRGHRGQPR
jgi:hypothetical protein